MARPGPLPFGPWWEVFRRLVERDDDVPVLPAAMALSHIVQGGQTWEGAEARLELLEHRAIERAPAARRDPERAPQIVVSLLAEEGLHGAGERYEDPDNSLIDRVLERGQGLPIVLSVLAVHLAGHADVELHPIGFPGHFVVGARLDTDDPLVLDPFHDGRRLHGSDLATQLARVTGTPRLANDDHAWRARLVPASGREIVARMLRNLTVHLHRDGEWNHARTARRLLQMVAADSMGTRSSSEPS